MKYSVNNLQKLYILHMSRVWRYMTGQSHLGTWSLSGRTWQGKCQERREEQRAAQWEVVTCCELAVVTPRHYHITNISRLLSDQSFPTQLGNNLVYFIYRSGSHNLSRRHTSSEWGPSHPQGADNWSSFLLFGDNWKISISLRLNSTVSSNEPIECQEGEQT